MDYGPNPDVNKFEISYSSIEPKEDCAYKQQLNPGDRLGSLRGTGNLVGCRTALRIKITLRAFAPFSMFRCQSYVAGYCCYDVHGHRVRLPVKLREDKKQGRRKFYLDFYFPKRHYAGVAKAYLDLSIPYIMVSPAGLAHAL